MLCVWGPARPGQPPARGGPHRAAAPLRVLHGHQPEAAHPVHVRRVPPGPAGPWGRGVPHQPCPQGDPGRLGQGRPPSGDRLRAARPPAAKQGSRRIRRPSPSAVRRFHPWYKPRGVWKVGSPCNVRSLEGTPSPPPGVPASQHAFFLPAEMGERRLGLDAYHVKTETTITSVHMWVYISAYVGVCLVPPPTRAGTNGDSRA